jgi:hypothetical protein
MADTAARLAISARRNEVSRFTIAVAGIDMTGVAMAMQIRLGRDVPGAPLISLATVTSLAAEGLKFDGVTTTNGVPTSIIKGRINASTMTDASKVPYMGEVGTDSVLAYAMQWTIGGDAQTRLYGDFIVVGSAFGSDGAPTNRPPSYGGSSATYGGSSTGSLTFSDQVIAVTLAGADLVGLEVAKAVAAAATAQDAANNPNVTAVGADLRSGASKIAAVATDLLLGAASKIALVATDLAKGAAGLLATALTNAQAAATSATQAGAARDAMQALVLQFGDRMKGFSAAKTRTMGLGLVDSYGYPIVGFNRNGDPVGAAFGVVSTSDGVVNADAIRLWKSKEQGMRFRGERAFIANPGDSQWVSSKGDCTRTLMLQLRAKYGDGGPGWAAPDGTAFPEEVSFSFTGSWSTTIDGDGANGRVRTSSTVDDFFDVAFTGSGNITEFELHHAGGGGTLSYAVSANGGSLVAGSNIVLPSVPGMVGLPVPPAGKWLARFKVISGTVKPTGAILLKPSGVVFHNYAIDGWGALHWAALDQTKWRAALSLARVDLALVPTGGNDEAANRTTEQFVSDELTIINTFRAISPAIDVIVSVRAQGPRPAGSVSRMNDYAKAMRALAVDNRFSFDDIQKRFGTVYTQYNFTGTILPLLQSDERHVNKVGTAPYVYGISKLTGC